MIGIDIGASSVRIVEVMSARSGPPTLRRFSMEGLPRGAVRAGVVHDARVVADAIARAARRAGIRRRARVTITATSVHTVVRELEVPGLSDRDLAGALPHLARDVLPIPLERAVLDFAPTARTADGRITSGYLVALPSDDVTSMVVAVEDAGFVVDSVDLGAFALLRALADASGPDAVGTVDLGASATTFVLEHEGVPALVRVLSRGGDDLTTRLAERLGVSTSEAEERKRRFGLSGGDPDVAAVCAEALRPLIGDLRSSLDYFRASPQGAGVIVHRLRLVGGGSLLPGISEFLGDALGLVAEPVDGVSLVEPGARDDLELFAPVAGPAIGLTLEDDHG